MSLTENQLTDQFQKTLGRPPTPFELSKYSNSSIQDLANLKDIYAKQDPNSLVGYLGSTGQDFSMPAMQKLAQEKGITNFGTPEGNDALLKALKGGTSITNPVGGSIYQGSAPSPSTNTQVNALIRDQGTLNPEQMKMFGANADGTPATGSVEGAADSFNGGDTGTGQPPKIEGVDSALQSYQDIQKQVADIDSTLRQSEQDIKNETAATGGFISASQLKGLVYERNKPMLEQRTQLVSEQAQYGKMYTDLLARQKESDQNWYRENQLNQGQQKITDTETKNASTQAISQQKLTDQEQQFTQKLEQAGWKSYKINTYDNNGKVNGNTVVWAQNPSAKSGFTADGTPVTLTGGGKTTNPTPTEKPKSDKQLVTEFFNKVKGGDGYVSPDDWKKALTEWVNGGNTAASFPTNFKNYQNPKTDYGKTGPPRAEPWYGHVFDVFSNIKL